MDDNIDSLLSMFSQMGTTDHDELVKQFQTILPGTTQEVCNFFLSANNWVLSNSISSYFDHYYDNGNNGNNGNIQSNIQSNNIQSNNINGIKPNACFQLQDDGVDQYYPDTVFYKKWFVTNSGTVPWPTTSTLRFISGEWFNGPISMQAPPLSPNQTTDVTIKFKTPTIPGEHVGCWQLTTNDSNATVFGEPFWLVIYVIPDPNKIQMGWGVSQLMQTNHENENDEIMDV